MEKYVLNAEIRESWETAKKLKATKQVAGVIYGKTHESTPIKIQYSDFLRTFRKTGESHIINLSIGKKETEVLVHSVQKQPVSGEFYHIDFYAITKGEKVHTKIPLNFTWESQAVREWNILEEHLKEIEVKCLPTDLVDNFNIDLSKLVTAWDSIRVSELGIDESKYEVFNALDDIVVTATKPAKVEAASEEVSSEKNTEDK
jgi:large subunit ribosomal protein L25